MKDKEPSIARLAPRARRGAWMALLALALVQITVAVHWSAHDPLTLEDRCGVCLQLDRLDQALSGSALAAAVPQTGHLVQSATFQAFPGIAPRYYPSRAPPRYTRG